MAGMIEAQLSDELRSAVLAEIAERGMDSGTVAARLDLVPTAVNALLQRQHWPLTAALTLADGLGVPFSVTVARQLKSA